MKFKKNYLAKNDGHTECPTKVVSHLKDLSKHGVWERQLSDHQQGLLRMEEAAEVTAAAAENEHTRGFQRWDRRCFSQL